MTKKRLTVRRLFRDLDGLLLGCGCWCWCGHRLRLRAAGRRREDDERPALAADDADDDAWCAPLSLSPRSVPLLCARPLGVGLPSTRGHNLRRLDRAGVRARVVVEGGRRRNESRGTRGTRTRKGFCLKRRMQRDVIDSVWRVCVVARARARERTIGRRASLRIRQKRRAPPPPMRGDENKPAPPRGLDAHTRPDALSPSLSQPSERPWARERPNHPQRPQRQPPPLIRKPTLPRSRWT
jgi:hypothetical protein